MISKRAVQNGGEYKDAVLIEAEPTDADSLIKNHIEAVKRRKKTNRIWLVIWVVILVIFLPNSIRSWFDDVEEQRTCELLEAHYDGVEIVEILPFKVNGVQTERTVIATVEDGIVIGGKYRNAEGKWEFAAYAYCPFTELDENGSFGHAFGTHDNSALLYFEIYDHHLYYPGDDRMLHKTYHIDRGLVTVVIDDKPIK